MSSPSIIESAASTFVCDCDEWARPACAGEPLYGEHEGRKYCVLHFPGKGKSEAFNKALRRKLDSGDFSFGGVWFPDEVSFRGFTFTADVDFRSATFAADADFHSATFNGSFSPPNSRASADFGGATFKAGVSFREANFIGTYDPQKLFHPDVFKASAKFDSATFTADADFFRATFTGFSKFYRATFNAGAHFTYTLFKSGVNFTYVTFTAAARFDSAVFQSVTEFSSASFNSSVVFELATFAHRLDFDHATFKDYVKFAGGELSPRNQFATDKSDLDLQFVTIDYPDRVYFHTNILRPHWFINVDARKFNFIAVEWRGMTRYSIKQEIEALRGRVFGSPYSPHRLLSIACRNLAVNAEDNHRYEEASKFRYMAMEARRLEIWPGFTPWRLSWWYWLASGYGERIFRAFVALVVLWLGFALLYAWQPFYFAQSVTKEAYEGIPASATHREADRPRDEAGKPLEFSDALTYSAGVITLQRPEPRPMTRVARNLVLLETLLGPLQAALLALAIRRKFMR